MTDLLGLRDNEDDEGDGELSGNRVFQGQMDRSVRLDRSAPGV